MYSGEYRSAIARARKILIAAELPWSVTTGRYSPFNNTQHTTYGVRVTRVGCSDSVVLNAWGDEGHSKEEAGKLWHLALTTLRNAGLQFDDKGWLKCKTSLGR